MPVSSQADTKASSSTLPATPSITWAIRQEPALETQGKLVDAITALDRHRNRTINDPETATRIAAYEMAFRMQTSVPDLMDVSKEPQHVLDMYGAKPGDGSYASNCLLARRLAERGVRFIHLYHRGWDHHGGLVKYMNTCCGLTDKPTWALIQDLKQRDMLNDTLVVWGGEFGRTPMFQGKGGAGRDHHVKGFSMWMAGGGIKGRCRLRRNRRTGLQRRERRGPCP